MKKLIPLVFVLAAAIAAPAPVEAGLLNLFSGNSSNKKVKKTSTRQSNRGNNGDVNVVVNGNGNHVNVDRSQHNHNTTVVNRTTVVAAPTMAGLASRDGRFTGGGRTSSCTPGDPHCRRVSMPMEPPCPNPQLLGYRLPNGQFVRELPPGMRVGPPVYVNGGGSPAPSRIAPPQYRRQSPPPQQHRRPAPRPSGPPMMASTQGYPMRHPSGSVHPNGYYTVWWAQGPGWGN
ncbi:MAG: hypothetical protein RL150_570 [Candidatus Parcubacteria bacterium]|jgi:hypothetical protein